MANLSPKINPEKGFPVEPSRVSNTIQLKHNDIQKICAALSSASDFEVGAAYEQLRSYKSSYQRWFYSDISNFLFGSNDSGVFLSNLEALQEYAEDYLSSLEGAEREKAEEISIMIDKLWDHSNLAQMQVRSLRETDDTFRERFNSNIEPRFAKLTEETNKQLISLIGIFTALSFIVFGGISSLDNIFATVGKIPIIELVIVGCMWGICILNLVFAFVYLVSKLTKLPIAATDKPDAKLVQKHPFWVWSNYLMLLILAVFCWIYYIDYSNSGSWLIAFSRQHSILSTVLGSLCIIVPFGIVALRLIRSKNK